MNPLFARTCQGVSKSVLREATKLFQCGLLLSWDPLASCIDTLAFISSSSLYLPDRPRVGSSSTCSDLVPVLGGCEICVVALTLDVDDLLVDGCIVVGCSKSVSSLSRLMAS